MINIRAKTKVKNTYELTLKHPDGQEEKFISHNMVLDNYYAYTVKNNNTPRLSVIRVGQGTTAVAASQVALANARASYEITGANIVDDASTIPAVRTLTRILAEGVLTGNISEIGLSSTTAGSVVYTRSLVQDAEGNPITINKGELDILTIRVIVFYEFLGYNTNSYLMNTSLRQKSEALMTSNGWAAYILDPHIRYYDKIPSPVLAESSECLAFLVTSSMGAGTSSGTFETNVEDKTIRANGITLLAAQYNGNSEFPEWAARGIGDFGYMIDIEASGLFTPYQYNNLPMGVGDGIETGFDIPLVAFKAADVEVLINDIIQDPSTYTVLPQSLRRSLRSAPSAEASKVTYVSDPAVVAQIITSGRVNGSNAGPGRYKNTAEIRYDFDNPIPISDVFVKTDPFRSNISRPLPSNVDLSISDDGVSWTQAFYHAGNVPFPTTFSVLPLSSPVSSRYVRLTFNTGVATYGYETYDPILAFGVNKKSVTFNSPPPSGATITAKVLSRIPIKNSSFQLGSSVQMRFERG